MRSKGSIAELFWCRTFPVASKPVEVTGHVFAVTRHRAERRPRPQPRPLTAEYPHRASSAARTSITSVEGKVMRPSLHQYDLMRYDFDSAPAGRLRRRGTVRSGSEDSTRASDLADDQQTDFHATFYQFETGSRISIGPSLPISCPPAWTSRISAPSGSRPSGCIFPAISRSANPTPTATITVRPATDYVPSKKRNDRRQQVLVDRRVLRRSVSGDPAARPRRRTAAGAGLGAYRLDEMTSRSSALVRQHHG